MDWVLRHGDDPAAPDPPAVPDGYHEWLEAFWEISTDRPVGWGAAPIPYGAIRQWMDSAGLVDLDERACFLACVRAMDAAWLDFAREGEGGDDPPAPKPSKEPMTGELFDRLFGG